MKGLLALEGLSYSELEMALADLEEVSPEDIRTRFRHLRLKAFPPGVRTGTGNRVRYDAASVLACAFAFELNRAGLPQASCTDAVETGFAELAASTLAGLAQLKLVPTSRERPAHHALVHIQSFGGIRRKERDGREGSPQTALHHVETVAPGADLSASSSDGPVILLDTRRVARIFSEQVPAHACGWANELERLDHLFGLGAPYAGNDWKDPERVLSTGVSFLAEGPFWRRALCLLEADPKQLRSRRARWFQKYLASPAPVDGWKRYVRFEQHLPLIAAIQAWWTDQGLEWEGDGYPETVLLSVPRDELRERLVELVLTAQAYRPASSAA